MLTYLLSGAVALVVGGAGGFFGGRLSTSRLRRDYISSVQDTGLVIQDLRSGIGQRPTRDELTPFLQALSRLTASTVTREQLEPVLQEVVTRQEVDLALTALVDRLSRSGVAPSPEERAANAAGGRGVGLQYPAVRSTPEQVAPAAALSGANTDQLVAAIGSMRQQMDQINQQLGLV
jgi:hypothetical protein